MTSTSDKIQWSEEMASSVINRYSKYMDTWCYEFGLMLKAIEKVWEKTGDVKFYNYIKENVDAQIDSKGNINGYTMWDFNLDQINSGKIVISLYNKLGEEKYKKAIDTLREQIANQPRTLAGGFWHKAIYPNQMWLDGLFMCSPFYAEYSKTFNEPESFSDIINQFNIIYEHTLDSETGLLYHAWDESKGMKWSNDKTGCSPHFWGRALGWYLAAIVDTLDFIPENSENRDSLIRILNNLAMAVFAVQDPHSGVWYQVLDHGSRRGNYLESSSSSMFIYAFTKAINNSYLNEGYVEKVNKAYDGIIEEFIEVDENDMVNLKGVCAVAGLGNNPYRDGSFNYYINEPVAANDFKGVGPFILASIEIEKLRGDKND